MRTEDILSEDVVMCLLQPAGPGGEWGAKMLLLFSQDAKYSGAVNTTRYDGWIRAGSGYTQDGARRGRFERLVLVSMSLTRSS
jgi:hypothetical protein